MIYYDTENLLQIIFRWHGSALNGPGPRRAVVMALFALLVAVVHVNYQFVVHTRESTAFVDTLTVFNTFLGLLMSFRMNSAFQQWRAGVVAISALSEAARGIVASGCAYVSVKVPTNTVEKGSIGQPAPTGVSSSPEKSRSPNDKISPADNTAPSSTPIPHDVIEKCTFFKELRRLVFLYIAIVFHDFRGRDGIDKMREAQIITPSEYDELYACGSEQAGQPIRKESYHSVVLRTQHKYRATVVELWLKRLVEVAAQRGHLSPGNASVLHNKISQLPSFYTTVFNIANVPIPFNYMQYLQFLIIAYMVLYTFVIVPNSGYYTPLWVLMWGMFLFTADQIAMEIECPFGLDANDIDLEARLLQIEEELKLLIRSQYYFMSGGRSYTKLSGSNSSVRTTSPNSYGTSSYQNPELVLHEPMKESFSFHQGHLPRSPSRLPSRDSLPEIDEYTSLIVQNRTDLYGIQRR